MSKDGEQAWHLRRQQWTQASDETLETKKQKAQELNDWYNDHLSTEKRLEMFHKTFVVKRVQTNKPVPLRFAVSGSCEVGVYLIWMDGLIQCNRFPGENVDSWLEGGWDMAKRNGSTPSI